MPKISKVFVCSKCDAQYPKWNGQCTECGAWGTIAEQASQGYARAVVSDAGAELNLVDLEETKITALQTFASGLKEFDRVLGGGFVAGGVVLLGGSPGVGKSTLALQAAGNLANSGKNVIYFSGEESASQVAVRYKRLGLKASPKFSQATHLESILKTLAKTKPDLAVVDAVQMLQSERITGEPGNLSQMRGGVAYLVEAAKRLNVALILISHVTKDGVISGPKTVEHLVDTVLMVEADEMLGDYRILQASKNRFGSTSEIGIFKFGAEGFVSVENAGQIFLSEISESAGSVLTLVTEGKRSFILEVQALVQKSSNSFPKRSANGFDPNRLQMLLAVLGKWAKLPLDQTEVHINISGGLKIKDVSLDAAVCLAVASSFYDMPITTKKLFWGEVSLTGQIKKSIHNEAKQKAAQQLGYTAGVEAEKTLADLIRKYLGKS